MRKSNDLLKDLWLRLRKAPFHFTDKVTPRRAGAAHRDRRLKPAIDARKMRVQNDIPDTLPPLMVDKPKFVRLFELLLKDELVSLPEGSHITLSAHASPETPNHRREVIVEVRNDGPGLSAEAMRLLFDPFVARSDESAGIRNQPDGLLLHYAPSRRENRGPAG